MKLYLQGIAQQLSHFSASLNTTSLFLDKPWALIDEESKVQKLIFKRNKELVLSKNGQVQFGKWEYYAEARSLLIDRNYDKILCNESFIDKGIMILKVDGTDNKFFVLVNENIVPNLNADKYLKSLRYKKLHILETKLDNGKILEVQRPEDWSTPIVGNPVSMNALPVEDGKYNLEDPNKIFEIRQSKILKILTSHEYTNPDGHTVIIQQQYSRLISKGDYVYYMGRPVKNGTINFSKTKNLIVKDGILVKKESKNKVIKWLGNNF